jgi:hypothetical protein
MNKLFTYLLGSALVCTGAIAQDTTAASGHTTAAPSACEASACPATKAEGAHAKGIAAPCAVTGTESCDNSSECCMPDEAAAKAASAAHEKAAAVQDKAPAQK